MPGTINESEVYETLLSVIEENGVLIIKGRRGEKINLGGGAYIDVLFPDRDVSGLDTNTGSLVAKLIYGESSMLLTGDSPENIEQYLIRLDGQRLKSDVLKVGHHGSKTSTSIPFLGYVSPQYAAISVGADNSYGHPNKETIDALNQFEVETYRTDKEGTIRFVSDGSRFRLKN